MAVATAHALATHAGSTGGTDTVHDVVETGLEVGDLRVDLSLGVLTRCDLGVLLVGVVLQQLGLHVGDVDVLGLRDVGQRLAGLQLRVQLGGRELQHLRECVGGELRCTTARTVVPAHAPAALRANIVHHRVEVRLERGDLRVDLSLGVLTRCDLGVLLVGVVLQQLGLHVGDVHALLLRDRRERLRLQLGLQFGGGELQHLRECIGDDLPTAHSLAAGTTDVVHEGVDVRGGLSELRVGLRLGVLTGCDLLGQVCLQVGEDCGLHVGDVLALLLRDRREGLRLQLGLQLRLGQAECLRGVDPRDRRVLVGGETRGSGCTVDGLAADAAVVIGCRCDHCRVVLRGEFCAGEPGDAEDGGAGRHDEAAGHCDLRETGLVLHGWGFLCCGGCSPVVPG